jgi:hypothetical protein
LYWDKIASQSILVKGTHAENLVREVSLLIQVGDRGQAFFAIADGKNSSELKQVIEFLKTKL